MCSENGGFSHLWRNQRHFVHLANWTARFEAMKWENSRTKLAPFLDFVSSKDWKPLPRGVCLVCAYFGMERICIPFSTFKCLEMLDTAWALLKKNIHGRSWLFMRVSTELWKEAYLSWKISKTSEELTKALLRYSTFSWANDRQQHKQLHSTILSESRKH